MGDNNKKYMQFSDLIQKNHEITESFVSELAELCAKYNITIRADSDYSVRSLMQNGKLIAWLTGDIKPEGCDFELYGKPKF